MKHWQIKKKKKLGLQFTVIYIVTVVFKAPLAKWKLHTCRSPPKLKHKLKIKTRSTSNLNLKLGQQATKYCATDQCVAKSTKGLECFIQIRS